MTSPLILTHSDFDGWLAGAIAVAALRAIGEDPEVRHVTYGDPCPLEDARGRSVYVLDFGWPLPVMRELQEAARCLFWVDHHPASVQAELPQAYGIRASDRCAAWLTWRMFHAWGPTPAIADAADDHDRWVHALPATRALAAGVEALAHREGALWPGWSQLLADDREALTRLETQGIALLQAQERRVRHAGHQAVAVKLDGVDALAVNVSTDFNEVADHLGEQAPVVWLWTVVVRGGRPQVVNSLRARKGGVDVGELAKRRGGGGHPSAAGWTCDFIVAEAPALLAEVTP